MSLGWTIAVVALCLLVEGFHSGSEIAVYSADRIRLRHQAEKGSRTARMALRFVENTDLLLGTTLVGTNLATVTATLVIGLALAGVMGGTREGYTVLIMVPLTLILGELIPKSLYQKHADRVVLWAAYPLWAASRVFYPVGWILTRAVRLLLGVFGAPIDGDLPHVTREDLRFLLSRRTGAGDIMRDEELMVRRVLAFRETTVEQAMKPLVDVHAFREDTTVREALEKMAEDRYSRYPVFGERIVNITGVVAMLDLIYCDDVNRPVGEHRRPVLYVPEGARIEEVFPQMQQAGMHLAVAVDEYGGAAGIITIEDILEEIVGEIEDEYDEEEKALLKVGDNLYLVRARTEIDRINEMLNLRIPGGDYETLAGFLLHRLGRIPAPGERIVHGELTFVVVRVTDRAIEEVYLSVERKEGKDR